MMKSNIISTGYTLFLNSITLSKTFKYSENKICNGAMEFIREVNSSISKWQNVRLKENQRVKKKIVRLFTKNIVFRVQISFLLNLNQEARSNFSKR